jgi:hypothetical protein
VQVSDDLTEPDDPVHVGVGLGERMLGAGLGPPPTSGVGLKEQIRLPFPSSDLGEDDQGQPMHPTVRGRSVSGYGFTLRHHGVLFLDEFTVDWRVR